MSSLPRFRYHPNPERTGEIVASGNACKCCGVQRGYVYARDPYGHQESLAGSLCPWCIHDGSAHARFDVAFADDYELRRSGIDPAIIDEVVNRTPGYVTWQGERWLSHCNDACAFMGDATREQPQSFAAEHAEVVGPEQWDESGVKAVLQDYQPGGSPAFYRFECLHCGKVLYAIDCD